MTIYSKLFARHAALNRQHVTVEDKALKGPRVMIIKCMNHVGLLLCDTLLIVFSVTSSVLSVNKQVTDGTFTLGIYDSIHTCIHS